MTVYRERSKILGRDGCTDGLRALSSFSATLADQRLPDSVNRSNSTRSTDISGLKRALLCETRARPLSRRDRLPSIKLPHHSTKGVPFSKQVRRVYFSDTREKVEVEGMIAVYNKVIAMDSLDAIK